MQSGTCREASCTISRPVVSPHPRFWLFKPDEAPYQLKSQGDIAAGVQVEVYKHLLPDVHAVHQAADYTKASRAQGSMHDQLKR